jgi:DNA-nicking Smr family endonuclease
MSRSGRKPGGGGRAISEDEVELWQHATRGLEPVRAKPRVRSAADQAAPAPAPARPPPPHSQGAAKPAPSRPPVPGPPAPAAGRAAPLADFDRRQARRVAAGKLEIEARIDLHGLRQRDARARLVAFLREAHAKGRRMVLVITGKGGEPERGDHLRGALGEAERGVLRRNVPLWLEEPEFRSIVLSFTPAAIRHGGDGALYVQLRKGRR